MPATRRGWSTTKRNRRRRRAERRFEQKAKIQEEKIGKLQKAVIQLQKQSKLTQKFSTTRTLPDFHIDGVQQIPMGSVMQLPSSSIKGKQVHAFHAGYIGYLHCLFSIL